MHRINGFTGAELHAQPHRKSWKQALGSVFGAAARLHHYRDVHTLMLRSALCEVDGCSRQENCDDE